MNTFDVIYDVERVVFKNSTNDFCIIKAKNVKIDEQNNKNLDSFIIKGTFTGVAEKTQLKVFVDGLMIVNMDGSLFLILL